MLIDSNYLRRLAKSGHTMMFLGDVLEMIEEAENAVKSGKTTLNVMLDEGAIAPTRAHETDAGLDIYSMDTQIVPAHGSATFGTGVHVVLPHNMAGLLVSKSGLNVKNNITSTGLIDEGYTGEIKVKLYNHGNEDYLVLTGEKISQLVLIPVDYASVRIVDSIEGTDRGTDGFGSTGR